MSRRPFLFNVVVWNERYTRQLIDFTIPSLLAPNNIPKVVGERPCEFMIVTTPDDAELIKVSASFRELGAYLPITFVHLDFNAIGGNKYARMTAGHERVCSYGQERGAYGLFLMPEMLVADGTIRYFDRSAATGARAIVMPILRLIEEEVDYLRGPDRLSISKRELVRLLFEHAHHEIRTFMVTNNEFSGTPGFVIWPIKEKNVWIIHGLHTQPILVDLSTAASKAIGHTIDSGDFVKDSIKDRGAIDIVGDSDIAMICSLTSMHDVPTTHNWVPPTSDSVRKFIRETPNVNPLHKWYFTHPVVFHSEDRPVDMWRNLQDSAEFVARALA